MIRIAQTMTRTRETGTVIPAFNIPHLPMMEPVIRAVRDADSFALIEVARLEWTKFQAQSLERISEAFAEHADGAPVSLHLDHIPVIDEDGERVDYMSIIDRAIAAGYQSVMVDGSRLPLDENIRATREVAERAHEAGVPCEAELGAVMGHEAGPLPPYEELFASKAGFTDVAEATRFVQESGCDWLSVAAGSIHGAVSGVKKDQKKVEARLDVDHIRELSRACNVPLVLHGGSGIKREYVLEGIKAGICKVNVGTELRQTYEQALRDEGNEAAAQDAVYRRTSQLITEFFGIGGSRSVLAVG